MEQQGVITNMDCSQSSGDHMPTSENSEERIPVTLEVCLRPESSASYKEVSQAVEGFLSTRTLHYRDGVLDVPQGEQPFLTAHVEYVKVCDTRPELAVGILGGRLLFWQVQLNIHVFQLNEEGVLEDDEGEDSVPAFKEWVLPSRDFDGLWESLVYESSIKQRLLSFATSALRFSDVGVRPHCISWNRTVLLHGPPGTGKTSLCKALAQKLAVKFHARYPSGQLIEVNAHSLFSKWFSESGKLVSRLFSCILERVEETDCLVFVLIDEVESLTTARKKAAAGGEPSDSIRAVNALLTNLDGLKRYPNVIVLTTSNITEAIDLAFVDRADIKAYIGPPSLPARYDILRSCLEELQRVRLVAPEPIPAFVDLETSPSCGEAGSSLMVGAALRAAAEACEGLSGRALRKLPFLTHASASFTPNDCPACMFLRAMQQTAEQMREELQQLAS